MENKMINVNISTGTIIRLFVFAPFFLAEFSDFAVFIQKYLPDSKLLQNVQNGNLEQAKNVIEGLTNGVGPGDLIRNAEKFITNVSTGFFQTITTIFGGVFNLFLIA